MEKRVCIKCNVEKELTEFYSNNKSSCKVCVKERDKEYYQKNKDRIKERDKEYRENNKDRIKEYYQKNKEYKKEYYQKNKEYKKEYRESNKDRIKGYQQIYRENNKDRIKEYRKNHYQNNKEYNKEYSKEYGKDYIRLRKLSDPIFKLKINLRSKINLSLKNKGYTKKSKSYEILGCSFEKFKLHIESQFKEWMNWDNYGLYNGEEKYGWDLDHIIPLSSGKCEEDIIRLSHHSNIQPLCSYVNRYIKRNNI